MVEGSPDEAILMDASFHSHWVNPLAGIRPDNADGGARNVDRDRRRLRDPPDCVAPIQLRVFEPYGKSTLPRMRR